MDSETIFRRRRFLAFLAGTPLVTEFPLWGWQARTSVSDPAEKEAQFTTGVRVVNVLASVRDKKGKISRDLKREDFLLTEDERPQEIRYFSQQNDQPLTLGLLIDVSGSQVRVIEKQKAASREFLKKVLRESVDGKEPDQGFIIGFAGQVKLEQDLTSSRQTLDQAVDDLSIQTRPPRLQRFLEDHFGKDHFGQTADPPFGGNPFQIRIGRGRMPIPRTGGGRGGAGRGGPGPGGRGGPQLPQIGSTALYDAIFLASDEVLKQQPGRKAIIVLSNGEDIGSKVSLSSAIEASQRADVLIYSIRFEDDNGYGRDKQAAKEGEAVLKRISEETGGGYFDGNKGSKKEELDKIFAKIEEELRSQYSLGYQPPQGSNGYRSIGLTVKPKGYTVQTRAGYYMGEKSSR